LQKFVSHIDKETVNSLPRILFSKEIVVVNNENEANNAVEYLSKQTILGFDTETKPSFHKGLKNKMALLQLASDEKVYLFRLQLVGIPDSLVQLIENENIKKIGAAIHDDVKGLLKIQQMQPAGFVDLQQLVQKHGIEDKSLQKMAAIVLGKKVSKAQRLTNWENPELSMPQQLYAATDAWVCLEIFKNIDGKSA